MKKRVKANHTARAVVTAADANLSKTEIVRRHLLAGRTAQEIFQMKIVTDGLVYAVRRKLEDEGLLKVPEGEVRRAPRGTKAKAASPPLIEVVIHSPGNPQRFFAEPQTFERVWTKVREHLGLSVEPKVTS